MKKNILIILTISSFLVINCKHQNSRDGADTVDTVESHLDTFKDSDNSINQNISDKLSYDVFYSHSGGDVERLTKMYLVIDSFEITIDTIKLTSCHTGDRGNPAYYWLKNKEYLLFEDCGTYPNKLKIMDLDLLDIIFEDAGMINFYKRSADKHLDSENNILVYFSAIKNQRSKFYIKKLNLESFTQVLIDSITTSGDPLTGIPWVDKINTDTKSVNIRYETKEYSMGTLTYNYGK